MNQHTKKVPLHGKAEWQYKALITISGVTECYAFKTHEQMEFGLRKYQAMFPMIQISIIECEVKYWLN